MINLVVADIERLPFFLFSSWVFLKLSVKFFLQKLCPLFEITHTESSLWFYLFLTSTYFAIWIKSVSKKLAQNAVVIHSCGLCYLFLKQTLYTSCDIYSFNFCPFQISLLNVISPIIRFGPWETFDNDIVNGQFLKLLGTR